MKEYSVCLPLNKRRTSVLLLKKNKTAYAGRYNGIGGLIRENELASENVLRKLREEVNVTGVTDLMWLGTLRLSTDCSDNSNEICQLYFYGVVIEDKDEVKGVDGGETPEWFSTEYVLNQTPHSDMFAGDGDIQYFLNRYLYLLGRK